MIQNHIDKKQAGFTLIELIVVISIVTILSTLITIDTSGNSRRQEAAKIVSDIRRAQALTLSGSKIENNKVCGYGIHWTSSTSYILYQGRSNGASCSSAVPNYEPLIDGIVDTKIVDRPKVEIADFQDIFFVPPDPKTYINNSNDPGVTTQILVRAPQSNSKGLDSQGTECANNTCVIVTVSTSGRIDVGGKIIPEATPERAPLNFQ